ncbi:MAG: hypothetical protein J6X48_08725 [Lachnospiraceae bacterium]|nr:hypothetical protein [Lachnospiraceae bacterium]
MSDKKDKKGKKIFIGVLIGLGVSIMTLFVAFVVFMIYFFVGDPVKVTKGADKYENTMNKYTKEVVGKVHTGLYTFPETIPDSAFLDGKEPVFYFSYKDTFNSPTCEVYLECEYSKEDYEKEIGRLRDKIPSKEEDPKLTEYLKYEEPGRFSNPVYIALDKNGHSYEYAMDLGDNKIAYIYTSYKQRLSKIKAIPKEYLPNDFEKSFVNLGWRDGFNVYLTQDTEGFRTFDYDR